MVQVSCGFDSKFFKLLDKYFENKTVLQKHGFLIFDEMSTRESINVSSQTLTYDGLLNFGDEAIEKECIANIKKKKRLRRKREKKRKQVSILLIIVRML